MLKLICLVTVDCTSIYKNRRLRHASFGFLLSARTGHTVVGTRLWFVSTGVVEMMRCNKLLRIVFTFTAVVLLYVSNVSSENQPVVNTPLGEIKGYYMKTREGKEISAFTAIPFAVPPVGDLRFKVGNV